MKDNKTPLNWHKNKTTVELLMIALRFGVKNPEKMDREELIETIENTPVSSKANTPEKLLFFSDGEIPEKDDKVLFLTEKKAEKIKELSHAFIDSVFDILQDKI